MILKNSGLAAVAFRLLIEINVFLNYLLIAVSGKVCLGWIRAVEWLLNHQIFVFCKPLPAEVCHVSVMIPAVFQPRF
jgi:hypothetical protein